jgi:hypothetical protein
VQIQAAAFSTETKSLPVPEQFMRMPYGLLNAPADPDVWARLISQSGLSSPPDNLGIAEPAQLVADGYPAPFGIIPVAATRWFNRDGGRGISDGPTNGNWGGKHWSGGRYVPDGRPNGVSPPVDSGDELYMAHDLCWDRANGDPEAKRACDRGLVKELDALPASPKDWPKPPPQGTESATDWYRFLAKHWFD